MYDYFNDTGRLKSVDGPLANDANHKDVVTYTWDRSGRLSTTTMFTKGGGQTDEDFVTLVRYNDAGEQIRIASDLSADGSKVQIRDYTYTYAGQLDSTIERHGTPAPLLGDLTTTNTYDNGGRLVGVDSPIWPGASDLVFVVDDLGREISRYRNVSGSPTDRIDTSYLQDGSVDTVTRAGQTLDYGYDSIGRTKTLAGPSSTTTWTYQGSGLLGTEAVTGPSLSLATTYTYYAGEAGGSRGQLKTVADQVTGGTTTYTYDAAGRVLTRADPGGLTWTRAYEAQSGLPDTQAIKKTNSTPVSTFEYIDLDHDVAGNLISRIQKLWAAGTTSSPASATGNTGTNLPTTYAYDGAGRMITATGPKANGTNATWAYAYDGQGNRTSFTGPGPSGATITLNTTTDNQGWPTAIDDPSTTGTDVALTHDEAGDLTIYDAQGTASDLGFSYDSWGLTSSGTSAGTTASYTLDPLGRIASRTQGSETIAYDYAGGTEDAVRSVATGGSAPGTTTFAFTPGGPLAPPRPGRPRSTWETSTATWLARSPPEPRPSPRAPGTRRTGSARP